MKKIFNKQIFIKTLKTTLGLAFMLGFFVANYANAEIVTVGVLSNGATGKIEIQDNSKIETNFAKVNVSIDFDPDTNSATQFKLPDGVSTIYVNLKSPTGAMLSSQKIVFVSSNKPTSAPIFTYDFKLDDFFIANPDPASNGNKAALIITDQNSKVYYQSDSFQVFSYTKQQAAAYGSGSTGTGTGSGTNTGNAGSGAQQSGGAVGNATGAGGAVGTATNTANGTAGGNPASGTTGTETPKSGLQITLTNPLKSNTLEEFVQIVLGVILKFLIPILAILFMYTGFKLVTARGDVKALTAAKQDFLNLVIGAVLILGAWTFGSIIMNTLKEVGILN